MKKLLSVLLLLLVAVTLLTFVSCGAPKETTADTSVTTTVNDSGNPPGTSSTAVTTTPDTPTVTTAPNAAHAEPVKLMTFNLRYDTNSHPCMSTEVRGGHLMQVIDKYQPDSIGFNEATNNWMNYLRDEMKKRGYECVGVGRDAGNTGTHLSGQGNEHTPIFYRADKYELLDDETFWLSTIPSQKGSKAWNTSNKRICTYAVLKNKETGDIYAHFGTHLDHKSEEARNNGVMVIESYIRSVLEKYGDIGIALSGDFNDSRTSTTYRTVNSFMDDSRALATKRLIDGSSWSGYQSPPDWENGHASNNDKPAVDTTSSPIDYIFLQKGTAEVSLYTIVDDVFTFEYDGKTWTNHPISDHYGVFCEATFTKPTKTMTYDESKLTSSAQIQPSETLPTALENLPSITDRFTISSGIKEKTDKTVQNLLLNDDSVASINVYGNKHGYWEITLTAENKADIHGIAITTGSRLCPQILRVFSSINGSDWNRIGNIYTDEITASTTYYIVPAKTLKTNYIKILFSDCVNNVELVNITVY